MTSSLPVPFVVFVNSRFPCLSETFIFDQFQALKQTGLRFAITSNHRPTSGEIHPHMEGMLKEVHYLCDASYGEILTAHWQAFLRSPTRYSAALLRTLRAEERWTVTLRHLTGAVLILRRFGAYPRLRLHAHFTYGAAAVVWWAHQVAGVPYTLTLHGSDLIYDHPPDLAAKLASADALVSISWTNTEYLKRRFSTLTRPISVIPLGVPPLPPPLRRPREGPWRLLNIGRLSKHKAQHVLIEACRLLAQQGVDFHCSIVGEGPERDALAHQIQRSGLSHRITLLGARFHEEVLAMYGQADIFILSSLTEGMPIVLMEAMRAGLPVVATRVGAVAELVQDGGIVVPPHDPSALAAAVATLIRGEINAEALGARAQEIIRTHFDLERNTARFRDFLLAL